MIYTVTNTDVLGKESDGEFVFLEYSSHEINVVQHIHTCSKKPPLN